MGMWFHNLHIFRPVPSLCTSTTPTAPRTPTLWPSRRWGTSSRITTTVNAVFALVFLKGIRGVSQCPMRVFRCLEKRIIHYPTQYFSKVPLFYCLRKQFSKNIFLSMPSLFQDGKSSKKYENITVLISSFVSICSFVLLFYSLLSINQITRKNMTKDSGNDLQCVEQEVIAESFARGIDGNSAEFCNLFSFSSAVPKDRAIVRKARS